MNVNNDMWINLGPNYDVAKYAPWGRIIFTGRGGRPQSLQTHETGIWLLLQSKLFYWMQSKRWVLTMPVTRAFDIVHFYRQFKVSNTSKSRLNCGTIARELKKNIFHILMIFTFNKM